MSAFVDKAIHEHKAVMFSWVHCPYCKKAKTLLTPLVSDFKYYDIDQMPEGAAIKDAINERYHHETVPAIFINGKFIGGCSDVEALKNNGELEKMLKA